MNIKVAAFTVSEKSSNKMPYFGTYMLVEICGHGGEMFCIKFHISICFVMRALNVRFRNQTKVRKRSPNISKNETTFAMPTSFMLQANKFFLLNRSG